MIVDHKPYPQYTPSGVGWFDALPAHWILRRGEVAFRKNGEAGSRRRRGGHMFSRWRCDILLPDEDAEVDPVPAGGGGSKTEPELDRLSNILRAFNDLFGDVDWADADRVGELITRTIPSRVAADTGIPQRAAELRPGERPHRARQGAAAGDDLGDEGRHRAVQAVHGQPGLQALGKPIRCSRSPANRRSPDEPTSCWHGSTPKETGGLRPVRGRVLAVRHRAPQSGAPPVGKVLLHKARHLQIIEGR